MSKFFFRSAVALLLAALALAVPRSPLLAAGCALAGVAALLFGGVMFWLEAVARVAEDDPARRDSLVGRR